MGAKNMSDTILYIALFIVGAELIGMYFVVRLVIKLCNNFVRHINIIEKYESKMKIFSVKE